MFRQLSELELIRSDRENLRDQTCTLVVLLAPGTPEERRVSMNVTLSRTEPVKIFALSQDGTLTASPTNP
ncbi:MAG: hypothetical protein J0L92_05205 [Deltaproteobacteria bacterium]|nr:hypothetical protein [Deltaproteobacteria bacterium]